MFLLRPFDRFPIMRSFRVRICPNTFSKHVHLFTLTPLPLSGAGANLLSHYNLTIATAETSLWTYEWTATITAD